VKKKHLSRIDCLLIDATWVLQDREAFDRNAALGVALSEFHLLAAFHRPETPYEWVRQPGCGISTYMRIFDLVGIATGIPAIQAKGHKSAYREAMTKKYRR